MAEYDDDQPESDPTRLEPRIWGMVGAFRVSELVHVPGMADTPANWLHELAKHQEFIRLADEMTPYLPPAFGQMSEEELFELARMRAIYPSDEDMAYEELYPSG